MKIDKITYQDARNISFKYPQPKINNEPYFKLKLLIEQHNNRKLDLQA